MSYIRTFSQISQKDVGEVGGKGASLGEMLRKGLPIPVGFVITTKAYNKALTSALKKEIFKALEHLKTKKVAVRSSAIAEDSKTSSWAGQLESYLNITKYNLIENIKKCWNSIKSERALVYANQRKLSEEQLTVAVIVQKMVDSEVSGVIFTANPITNNLSEIMIESGFGLGELVVGGMITPDNFIVDKKTLKIKNKTIQGKSSLSDGQLKQLAKLSLQIEKLFKSPQDIEWAIDGMEKIWILQSRPVTTL